MFIKSRHAHSPRRDLDLIGSTEYVEIAGVKNIPAKIDTGADSSSIWASEIDVSPAGVLSFCLFDKSSPLYTGDKIQRQEYKAKVIRSSNGDEEIRYRVELPLVLAGHSIKARFTLADRSKNNFPVLIGRKTLKGKFLVDVSKMSIEKSSNPKTPRLNRELAQNPYEFHQKYVK